MPELKHTSFPLTTTDDNGKRVDSNRKTAILEINHNGESVMICIENCSLIDTDVNVIVNAANNAMRGGGGIDGVIHKKAGAMLLKSLEVEAPNGCATGEVVVTPAFGIPDFKFIFHTPGPVWKGGGDGEAALLENCYWNSLNEANSRGLKSIGFCSISTGIYGYPLQDGANIAVKTILDYIHSAIDEVGVFNVNQIVFAMFKEAEYEAFCTALENSELPWKKDIEPSWNIFAAIKAWFKDLVTK